MSPIAKCLVFFALALSAAALTTPHISRNVYSNNHHRAVAHQNIAARAEEPVPASAATPKKRKRSLNKRCTPKASSSSIASSAAPSSSAPINVAPPPSVSSSSSSSAAASSSTQAAAPSTTYAPPPPPSTSYSPPPSTTSSAPPAQTSSASTSGDPSFLIGTQTGQGTYYATGLGACGITNTDTDYIAAVSHLLFDVFPGYNGVNPNENPVCNRKVTATYQGKSVTVAITDRCTGCALTDLDFSPSAFSQLASESVGRISGMTWLWD
ncbi:hypothetical protein BV22DRAFT_999245 [Leucogyrophana mollusca]|uniref:Uncharacterized protein n=1 Tax=Leucogyrophana mollusca TaxID=85980 RepID=A0ACB8BYI3_9AGAM|nr:hypothetical protein BV22DRAFT_999245 [Leucogyrophana mollusca]